MYHMLGKPKANANIEECSSAFIWITNMVLRAFKYYKTWANHMIYDSDPAYIIALYMKYTKPHKTAQNKVKRP